MLYLMGDSVVEQYRPLVAKAIEAFGIDFKYAVAIADHAGVLETRKESKTRKLQETVYTANSGV